MLSRDSAVDKLLGNPSRNVQAEALLHRIVSFRLRTDASLLFKGRDRSCQSMGLPLLL